MLSRLIAWFRGPQAPDGHPEVLAFAREADKALAVCRCSHAWSFHEHYRSGTDCSQQNCECPRFRPVRNRPLPM